MTSRSAAYLQIYIKACVLRLYAGPDWKSIFGSMALILAPSGATKPLIVLAASYAAFVPFLISRGASSRLCLTD